MNYKQRRRVVFINIFIVVWHWCSRDLNQQRTTCAFLLWLGNFLGLCQGTGQNVELLLFYDLQKFLSIIKRIFDSIQLGLMTPDSPEKIAITVSSCQFQVIRFSELKLVLLIQNKSKTLRKKEIVWFVMWIQISSKTTRTWCVQPSQITMFLYSTCRNLTHLFGILVVI